MFVNKVLCFGFLIFNINFLEIKQKSQFDVYGLSVFLNLLSKYCEPVNFLSIKNNSKLFDNWDFLYLIWILDQI